MRNNHAGKKCGPCIKKPATATAKPKAKAKAVAAKAKTKSAMPASIQADFKQRSRIYIMSTMNLYPKIKQTQGRP